MSDIAFAKGPCKECGGEGMQWSQEVSLGPIDSASHLTQKSGIQCPTCGGSGETYRLGEMVRKVCMYREATRTSWDAVMRAKHPSVSYHPDPCPHCHDGYTPSTELGDWVKAAKKLGYAVRFPIFPNHRDKCELVANTGPGHDAIDPDPLTALKLALGKCLEGR